MELHSVQDPLAIANGLYAPHSDRYVAGVDIGGTNLRVALADITGTIVSKWTASTAGIRDAEVIVRFICDGIQRLLAEQSCTRDSLLGIAAGAPGVTDTDNGIVIATSYLMGWRDVPLRDLLQSALGAPAFVDNDVNMAAFGEARAGAARGIRNFVFLAIGTGVGAGIVMNGQLIRGDSWRAGEVGYMLVPGTPVEPVDPGRPGPLESMVGGEGIRALWQSRWSEAVTALPFDLSATEIFDQARLREPLAQEVLEIASRTLAYAISNIAMILNCRLFVLGGSIGLHPVFAEATRAHLVDQGLRFEIHLEASALGAEAQITGAVFQALELVKLRGSEEGSVAEELVSGSASND